VFHFNQTNASGATTTGTVVAPYSGESMSGVSAQQIKYVGYQDVTASPASGVDSPVNVTLEQGGQRFDYLVFEAAGFVDRNGQPIDPNILMNYLDSSDYLVNGLSFTDSHGDHWKLMPDTGKTSLTRVEKNGVEVGDLPVGFALDAYKGVVMVAKDPRNGTDAGWGVDDYAIGGAMNQGEIQHNSQDGTSEQLLVALGDKVTRVDGVLAWLMNDQAWAQPKDGKAPSGPLLERARVHSWKPRTPVPMPSNSTPTRPSWPCRSTTPAASMVMPIPPSAMDPWCWPTRPTATPRPCRHSISMWESNWATHALRSA
jgi:hypothetical protein